MSQPNIEAKRVIYRGRVQGVGFRYTAHRIAQRHAVTGYVKNLRDGSVELVAEGSAPEIQRLLDEIAAAMERNIEESDVQKGVVTSKHKGFEVVL